MQEEDVLHACSDGLWAVTCDGNDITAQLTLHAAGIPILCGRSWLGSGRNLDGRSHMGFAGDAGGPDRCDVPPEGSGQQQHEDKMNEALQQEQPAHNQSPIPTCCKKGCKKMVTSLRRYPLIFD